MSNVSSCPSSVKPCRRRSKVGYRVRNWPDYDAGLQQRGSLTVWFTPQAVEAWYYQGPPQRGAQYTFSDGAIQTALTLRLLYHLPLRQTEGFVASVLALMGLAVRVPDHTTLSRRQADLAVAMPTQPKDQPLHLVVDATGLKVYGEGEWKVRQHGWNKRRTWRKLPLGVDEATGEIVAQTLTTNSQDDAGQVEPLLDQVEAPIGAVGGDGAYDRRKVLRRWPRQTGARRCVRSFRRAKTPRLSNMATAKPSRCRAMRRSEPSVNGAVERGKKPAAIIAAPSSKPRSAATNRSSATPCVPEPYPTNRPKHGWAVPCSTGCGRWPNPSPIR